MSQALYRNYRGKTPPELPRSDLRAILSTKPHGSQVTPEASFLSSSSPALHPPDSWEGPCAEAMGSPASLPPRVAVWGLVSAQKRQPAGLTLPGHSGKMLSPPSWCLAHPHRISSVEAREGPPRDPGPPQTRCETESQVRLLLELGPIQHSPQSHGSLLPGIGGAVLRAGVG